MNTATTTRTAQPVKPGRLSWETCFETFAQLAPETRGTIRANVAHALARSSRGFGVGSSDVNHALFAEYRMADGDWVTVIINLVNAA